MVVKNSSSENSNFSSWKNTIGRVAFMNCDPLFLQLSEQWNILSAPPSWLTGHLLRRDCIIAPIPAINCNGIMSVLGYFLTTRINTAKDIGIANATMFPAI